MEQNNIIDSSDDNITKKIAEFRDELNRSNKEGSSFEFPFLLPLYL